MTERKRAKYEIVQVIGEGNYLGKSPHNVSLTGRCWDLLLQLSREYGVPVSSIIELETRWFVMATYGEVPEIPPRFRRKDNG